MQEAFYRCSFDLIKRSNGDSVVKKAAYNARENIYRNESKTEINYSTKQDLLTEAILAPKGAGKWVYDRQQHYNKVEEQDNRCNSQLGRTLDIGLLHQLTLEQNKKLLEQYLEKNFVSRGMIADYCVHDADPNGDRRNIHAHIILSMRHLDGDGFSKKKAREWNEKKLLQESRIAWAVEANMMFQSLGMAYYIDHRSLKERGINRLPQRHEGKQATNLKRRKGVKVSKVTYNDLIKKLDRIDRSTQELIADEQLDPVQKIYQYQELFKACDKLVDQIKLTQESETAYWVKQRELEGIQIEMEEANIAKQYHPLWENSVALAETISQEIKLSLIADDGEAQEESREGVKDDQQLIEAVRDGVEEKLEPEKELSDFDKWVEEVEENSPEYEESLAYEQDNYELEPEPPDLELDSMEQSSTIKQNANKMTADNTELTALIEADKVKDKYGSTKNQKPKNIVTEYRLKLAEVVQGFDRQKVINHFKTGSQKAFNVERIIRDYLKRKGFNAVQIKQAMHRASPGLYKKSPEIARRYAKKLDSYLRQYDSRQRDKKQEIKQQKQQKKSRGRGR